MPPSSDVDPPPYAAPSPKGTGTTVRHRPRTPRLLSAGRVLRSSRSLPRAQDHLDRNPRSLRLVLVSIAPPAAATTARATAALTPNSNSSSDVETDRGGVPGPASADSSGYGASAAWAVASSAGVMAWGARASVPCVAVTSPRRWAVAALMT